MIGPPEDLTTAARWVIDFVNTDLPELTALDLYKLMLENSAFHTLATGSAFYMLHRRGGLDGLHKVAEEKLGRTTLQNVRENREGSIKLLQKSQIVFREFLEFLMGRGRGQNEEKVGTFDVLVGFSEGRFEIRYRFPEEENQDNPVDWDARARLSLLMAISDAYSGGASVRACRNCGKYFLHTSKRERFYCSPRCTSTHLARLRREKDREAYNAAQTEVRKRQYRRQKAKQLGIPVEKVKIRPKKSKKKR